MTNTIPTVLIVDDIPANLGVAVEHLEDRGYRVVIAQDGEEGLQRAVFVQPDVILLDVMLPGQDGFAICRRLKANAKTGDIPVIFMTALSEDVHKMSGFGAGGVDYITKPLRIEEMIARVDTHLRLRLLQKQLQAQNLQLELHRQQLGLLVAERTAELTASNRSLEAEVCERQLTEAALKESERQLREFSSHLQSVREEEKTCIAREIHDNLGGTLTALKMDLNWLMDELSANKEAVSLLKHTESMSQLLDNAAVVTRRVITDLRPTLLDDFGLPAALEWQAAQFHKRTGIQCRVSCSEDYQYELTKTQTINLFRIFQESLTNVARHSGASEVEVELQHENAAFILTISDNGCGLPEGHVISTTSYGMLGMRERTEQLGGRINFYSLSGGGFGVTVVLPQVTDNKNEEK